MSAEARDILIDLGGEAPPAADVILAPDARGRFLPVDRPAPTCVAVDGRSGIVTVQTGPGLPHPLFHACRGGRLIIGRTIAAVRARLCAHGLDAPLDPVRVGLTLCMDAMLGGMTPFAGIDMAGMGERLTFRPPYNGADRQIIWAPGFDDPRSAELDHAAAVGRMADILAALPVPTGRVLLPLSGGLDSRLLGGLVRRAGGELVSYTFRRGPSFEYDCAVRVARQLGAAHRDVDLPAACYDGFADSQVRISGGALTPMHVHNLFAASRLPGDEGRLPRVVGYFGDPVAGDFQAMPPMDIPDLAGMAIAATAGNSALITAPFRSMFQEILSDELGRRSIPPHRRREATALILRQQGLITHLFAPMEVEAPIHRPFVDPDYIAFGLGLPPAYRHRRGVFVAAAERLFPDLFSLPSTRLPDGVAGLMRRADVTVSKALQRISYAVLGPERGWRSRYTYEQHRSLLAGPLRDKLIAAHAKVADFLGAPSAPPDLARNSLPTALSFRVLAIAALLEEP